MSEWIPTSDRLPEDGKRVMAAIPIGMPKPEIDLCVKRGTRWVGSDGNAVWLPTHWMPLPEPPESR